MEETAFNFLYLIGKGMILLIVLGVVFAFVVKFDRNKKSGRKE